VTRLPPVRKRPRMGVKEAVQRVFQTHRAFLRSHQCVVPGCVRGSIEVSHLRNAANSGVGLKPIDSDAVPMCGGADPASHHAEYHRVGHKTFERKYGIDLYSLAAAFVRRTTDRKLKEFLRKW
jgi:hypothetical protein